MKKVLKGGLERRKTPVQARSAASVSAILEATVQVLQEVGKERLTTTRVAARAGVSVGTLYQYFPNKSALLRAVLEEHLGEVAGAVEEACESLHGQSLEVMATGLVTAYFGAKLRDVVKGRALYAVSDDVDGAAVVQQMSRRLNRVIAAMLKSSSQGVTTEAGLAALMLQGAMMGVSRRMLEVGTVEKQVHGLRRESITMACAYLEAIAAR